MRTFCYGVIGLAQPATLVLPKNLAKHVGYFPDCGVTEDSVENSFHEIGLAPRAITKLAQGRVTTLLISPTRYLAKSTLWEFKSP